MPNIRVSVTLHTDNAAFEDYDDEVHRLFAVVAGKVHNLAAFGGAAESVSLLDRNGNTVGVARIQVD